MQLNRACIVTLFLSLPITTMAQSTIEEFTRLPSARDVKISPSGKFLSAVFRRDGEDLLGVLDRETREPIASFKVSGRGRAVGDVTWVNDERIVYTVTESYHWNKQRFSNGELVGVDFDGRKHRLVFGYRSGESTLNTRIKKNKANYGNQEIIDLLEGDEENILIAFYPWRLVGNMWVSDPSAQTLIYKLNVYNGKTKKVDVLPYAHASAITDHQGNVRFAVAIDDNNDTVISFRPDVSSDWQEWELQGFGADSVTPLSFTGDDQGIYVLANVGQSTQGLYLFDLQSRDFQEVVHDEQVDITMLLRDFANRHVVGVGTDLGLPKYRYLDSDDKKVKLHRMLLKAFPGQDVMITSATSDGALAIAYVYSDTNSGNYYLFETESLKATYLLSQRKWLDPEKLSPTRAMTFDTRDGETLHGYVTLPRGKEKNVPLVVFPHGGPHGVRDYWGFDWEVQLLASRGYGVLQVNFRGSGGFGLDFEKAGYGKWGSLMQDDLTDATMALVESGVADKDRICIFGHSYGGYAALMGAVREPALYRCAIGSMGVYNLPMMFEEGDIPDQASGLAYLKQALGEDQADLQRRSPAFNAGNIQAEILLIHGARDDRAPIEQAESLKSALDDAGKSYQWLEIGDEAHGYYDEDNRRAVYEKVLAFLDANIGG